MKLATRVGWMKPSATLAMNARAQELRAAGVDVLSFAAGEPDFPTPAHVRKAAAEALEAGHTRYTAVPGDPELRRAVAEAFSSRTGAEVGPANVVVGCGAKQPLAHFFHAVLDPGDEVLVPTPCWVSYPAQIRIAGGVPRFVPTDPGQGFHVSADGLREAIGPRTRALVLNVPSNPTGARATADELAAIARVAIEADLWVVADEIYWRLTFDGTAQPSIVSVEPELAKRTLVIDGASKVYSMTGWRVGWGVGPEALVSALAKLQGEVTSCAPAFAQKATVAALRGDMSAFDAWLGELGRRRRIISDGLAAIDGVVCRAPEATFYVMADVRGLLGRRPKDGEPLEDALAIARYLLDAGRVAAVPGEPFEAPGFLRFSFACSTDTVERGVARVGEALAALR